jgi:hypothetical protein
VAAGDWPRGLGQEREVDTPRGEKEKETVGRGRHSHVVSRGGTLEGEARRDIMGEGHVVALSEWSVDGRSFHVFWGLQNGVGRLGPGFTLAFQVCE